MLSETPATIADLAEPAAVCTSETISGGKRLCSWRAAVVELQRPHQLHVLHAGRRDERLVPLPRRPLRVGAVGQPVRLSLRLTLRVRHAGPDGRRGT